MEINEKLDIFYRSAIEAANGQSEMILQEYQTAYQDNLAEYERIRQAEQQTGERIAQERVRKEVNRAVSGEIVRLKKEYHGKREEKKEELFALVEEKLAAYRKSDAYPAYLKRKINEAAAFAEGKEVVVYLDPEDAGIAGFLAKETGCSVSISETSFGGGIRAIIPKKNVLMDESFSCKLTEEKEKFSFL